MTSKYFLIILASVLFFYSCTKEEQTLPEEETGNIIYGIKHGDFFGYINSKGEIIIDSLDDGIIGEIEGEKTYKKKVSTEIINTPPYTTQIFEWKWYYKDGTVQDMAGEYEPSIGNFEIDNMYRFYDERAIVSKRGGKWNWLVGFIDEEGNEVIPCRYYWATHFNDGLAAVADTSTGLVGYIDKSGDYVIQPQYNFFVARAGGFNHGKAVVYIPDSGYKIIDKQNNIITDLSNLSSNYQVSFNPARDVSEGLLGIATEEGYGFANLSGEWEIEPLQYGDFEDFKNGFAIVSYGALKYFINKSGDNIFNDEYKEASNFDENNLAWVVKEESGSYIGMYIDNTGNQAFSGEFSGRYNSKFVNGLALVRDLTTNEWKYINIQGETELISPGEPITDRDIYPIGSFAKIIHGYFNSEGIALIKFDDDTFGYINKSGETLWRSELLVDDVIENIHTTELYNE